jgi:carboxyl-terminal processing protease
MRRAGAIVCLALVVAAAAAYGRYDHRARGASHASLPAVNGAPARPETGPSTIATPNPVGVSDEVEQVRQVLQESYYRPIAPEVLGLPTVATILEALRDPYTEYLSPESYEKLQARLQQHYFGVGLTVTPAEDGLMVTSSLRGPAREAGIRPGDVIVAIDGRPAGRLGLEGALSLITTGEGGSVVNITVRRPSSPRAMTFSVVRSNVALPILRSRMIRTHGHRIGYIRLFSFGSNASKRVERVTKALDQAGADGIVIDLRGNPGGLLTQAISVTSVFVKHGVVCSTEGQNQARRVYTVTGNAVEAQRPLAVLVDDHTASAAEILAAALASHRRATLVGLKTYGKATVQSIVPLPDGGALRLTTATYVTPSGEDIGGVGIKPAVKAVDDPLTKPDEAVIAAEKVLLRRL